MTGEGAGGPSRREALRRVGAVTDGVVRAQNERGPVDAGQGAYTAGHQRVDRAWRAALIHLTECAACRKGDAACETGRGLLGAYRAARRSGSSQPGA
ncbi:hypothetical protein [Streptomyces sp. SAJ15]|uniref:hypothetical protein n=1 Tax=Streptomyces sp. SAJ15 TaxID=2011095 RepID=UPI0011852BF5|nr:hypothetical protein [Streptomyces sp. SAJ15]